LNERAKVSFGVTKLEISGQRLERRQSDTVAGLAISECGPSGRQRGLRIHSLKHGRLHCLIPQRSQAQTLGREIGSFTQRSGFRTGCCCLFIKRINSTFAVQRVGSRKPFIFSEGNAKVSTTFGVEEEDLTGQQK
jgi:hypothetical protein